MRSNHQRSFVQSANRAVLALIVVAGLVFAVGCGGGGTNISPSPTPIPQTAWLHLKSP
jgi:hypothetical protein